MGFASFVLFLCRYKKSNLTELYNPFQICVILFQGRNFSGIIQSFVKNFKFLNDEALPAYATLEGRKAYEDTLNCLKTNFPQYVRELEGTADGSGVPFHKVNIIEKAYFLIF